MADRSLSSTNSRKVAISDDLEFVLDMSNVPYDRQSVKWWPF